MRRSLPTRPEVEGSESPFRARGADVADAPRRAGLAPAPLAACLPERDLDIVEERAGIEEREKERGERVP